MWLVPAETVKKTSSFVSLTLGSLVAHKCETRCPPDPFTRPGTLVRGPSVSDTRWVPFALAPVNVSAVYIAYDAPAPLDMVCPQYMQMLLAPNGTEMDWARNRTILFIGSSHDRNNIRYFCNELGGAYTSIGDHVAGACNITTHNLVFAFWFTYGAVDSDAYDWYSKLEHRPLTFESRISNVMLPWMAQQDISNPDLIIETSLFWDDGFLNQLSTRLNSTLPYEPLTYAELAWHRARVHALHTYTRTLFGGDVLVMFRTRHLLAQNTRNRIRRIFQLDQNLRAVAAALHVKLFRWGDLLEGVTTFYDDQHLVRGPVTWLFGDMVLFYLRQATMGCWACRDEL